MSIIFEVDGVLLSFGQRKLLQDVYLKCTTNQMTALIGRNGSGKSALLNVIYGALQAENASIRINGKALLGTNRKPNEMRFLPQHHFMPEQMRVKTAFYLFGAAFLKFIALFPEFEKQLNTPFELLSGGERRLVETYLILTADTKVCLLDEPFTHLMPLHIDRIKELIENEKMHKVILLTDHLSDHVNDLTDVRYFLKAGKLQQLSAADDLKELGYSL